MHVRFIICFVCVALAVPAGFAQDENQATVDQLVSKNIEAKGGADALHALQSLRLTGKMLVRQGQIELGCLQIKKRPDEVRDEASLQGMTQIEAYDGKEGWRVSPFFGRKGAPDKQRIIIDKVEANVPVDDAIFHFPGQISLPQPQR